MSQLVNRYASALFELAKENDCVVKWRDSATLIIKCDLNSNIEFFQSKSILTSEKKEVLKKAFNNKIDPYLMNFLFILIDKNRFSKCESILHAFNTLVNTSLNIEEGFIYTARKFDDEEIKVIEDTLSLKRDKKCILKNRIDERLISGFKIVISNEEVDFSMKNNIDSLKKELLKEVR
ncbi:MAG: ATP synthase F1 subunit delta [Anaerorhabdus sp.]